MYRFRFIAKGSNSFPLDMLAYDDCFPNSKKDAENILNTFFKPPCGVEDPRLSYVVLAKNTEDKNWQPSIGHWNNRGWSIERVTK